MPSDFLDKELFESKMAYILECLDGIRSSIDDMPQIRVSVERVGIIMEELKKDNIRLSNLQSYHKNELHKEIKSINQLYLEMDRKIQKMENDKKWTFFIFGLCWALFIAWYQKN